MPEPAQERMQLEEEVEGWIHLPDGPAKTSGALELIERILEYFEHRTSRSDFAREKASEALSSLRRRDTVEAGINLKSAFHNVSMDSIGVPSFTDLRAEIAVLRDEER